MARKKNEIEQLRSRIQKRLSADPGVLDLDPKIDEAAEDMIIGLSFSDERDLVGRVLYDLIMDYFSNPDDFPNGQARLFVLRSLRVCSFLQHNRLKPVFKLILLNEDVDPWGASFSEIKMLAARAMQIGRAHV